MIQELANLPIIYSVFGVTVVTCANSSGAQQLQYAHVIFKKVKDGSVPHQCEQSCSKSLNVLGSLRISFEQKDCAESMEITCAFENGPTEIIIRRQNDDGSMTFVVNMCSDIDEAFTLLECNDHSLVRVRAENITEKDNGLTWYCTRTDTLSTTENTTKLIRK